MGHFKQGGRSFGGGGRGDFKRGGFQKKSWNQKGDRGDDRKTMMHHARCSECGKDCEVPFKPTNGKPVFCKECFNLKDDNDRFDRPTGRDFGRNDRPKRNFERSHDAPRHSFALEQNNGVNDLKKQIEKLEVKVDRLIQSIENLNRAKPMTPKVSDEEIQTETVIEKKKVSKDSKKKPTKKPIKR